MIGYGETFHLIEGSMKWWAAPNRLSLSAYLRLSPEPLGKLNVMGFFISKTKMYVQFPLSYLVSLTDLG